MLAKYVEPVARVVEKGLTRTEVFRIFVDETIRGKLRTSREDLPIQFDARGYRMLLQEIAYLASWPKHAPKCPVRLVRERITESIFKELNFQDIRTAFVLHFFELEMHRQMSSSSSRKVFVNIFWQSGARGRRLRLSWTRIPSSILSLAHVLMR
jgi:hypothetical protein